MLQIGPGPTSASTDLAQAANRAPQDVAWAATAAASRLDLQPQLQLHRHLHLHPRASQDHRAVSRHCIACRHIAVARTLHRRAVKAPCPQAGQRHTGLLQRVAGGPGDGAR